MTVLVRKAFALAEKLGMRPFVSRCPFGLGKLYLKMGERQETGAELSSAIELYHVMEMIFWCPQAEE